MRMLTVPLLLACFIVFPVYAEQQRHWVDLTHPFDETTIYWPTDLAFRLDVNHKGLTEGGYWYESNNYRASEHGGTHIDAPVHFFKGQWSVDAIPLEHLIGPGIKIDVADKAHPDYLISEENFLEWESKHGQIPKNAIVLVYTGWERFWPDKKHYLGSDTPGETSNLHFPGFSREAAEFLCNKRKIHAIGLDTASLDYGQSKDFQAHQVFGAANVPGFENLHNLGELPEKGFRVIALPMKIGRGSGGPLRIVVEVP